MPRFYEKITVEDLEKKIDTAKLKHCDDLSEWNRYDLRHLTPQIERDLSKVQFDFENSEEEYRTLDNGMTCLWCWAGGDWESPVTFIIYWDGKKLRGYIPDWGDNYNPKTKKAWGNEDTDEELEASEGMEANEVLILKDIVNRVQPW